MPISRALIRHTPFLALSGLALIACQSESTAVPPLLLMKNETSDTLIMRVAENRTALSNMWLGITDTATAIAGNATPPGAGRGVPLAQIWGYEPGNDIRVDLYRVNGARVEAAGFVLKRNAELTKMNYFVAIRSDDINAPN
jgi:hypothetical protein